LPEPEFQPGQQIEDYIIERRLDRGGMGELYLARDKVLKRKVIIKVLLPPYSQRQEYRVQFLREAKIQANLDNTTWSRCSGRLCTEISLSGHAARPGHGPGEDCEESKIDPRKKKEKGALSVERAVHIFLQVLEGVGLPTSTTSSTATSNLPTSFSINSGRVKIVDFGLSFMLASGKKIRGRSSGGTLQLMSLKRS